MKNKEEAKISYDVESDILRIEISKQPIDHAREMGSVVVHFTKEEIPVYLEFLEAKKFVNNLKRTFGSVKASELNG